MAGFQPAEVGCVEVVFHFTLFGIPLVIVITVCLDTPAVPSVVVLNGIANQVNAWMTTGLMPLLSENLSYVSVQCTDISSSTGAQVTLVPTPVAGGVAVESLPSQLAVVVTLYTNLRGRSYRGRSFLPGIPRTYQDVASNLIITADASSLLTAYQSLDGNLASISCHQAVLSRVTSGARRPTALSQKVTSRICDTTIDTLRRRGANAHRS